MLGKTYDETLIVNICGWWDLGIYTFSLCLSIFYNFSTMSMYYQELGAGDVGEQPGPQVCPVSGPTLTLARMVKASGSSTRSSLFSVPSTKQDTASSSARFFFKVVIVVMTVWRRTPGSPQDLHTLFLPGAPRIPQEEEYQRCKRFLYKGVYCNKPNFLTKVNCLSQLWTIHMILNHAVI